MRKDLRDSAHVLSVRSATDTLRLSAAKRILAAVSFVGDLAANAAGGVVTAVVLGAWATRFATTQQIRVNDDRVADLTEDNRRWFRDRNDQIKRDLRQREEQRRQAGVTSVGIAALSQEAVQRWALVDYRNELTVKRRRYADICRSEGWTHRARRRRAARLPRFELTQEQRDIINGWRTVSVPDGGTRPLREDPTSEDREPDLRRFEREGDPPLSHDQDSANTPPSIAP